MTRKKLFEIIPMQMFHISKVTPKPLPLLTFDSLYMRNKVSVEEIKKLRTRVRRRCSRAPKSETRMLTRRGIAGLRAEIYDWMDKELSKFLAE